MARTSLTISLLSIALFAALPIAATAQPSAVPRSQEISEDDGLPVLVKHLPDWQEVRTTTVFVTNSQDLKKAIGDRPMLNEIDFSGGTEAVKADYPAGKLLIIEFTNPQGSSEADARIVGHMAADPTPGTVYRRIGNYNVFVFDAADEAAAVALLDRVRYEKTVQWLGDDPFLGEKIGRYFATTARDVLISTVLWIVGGLGLSAVLGVLVGLVYFRVRQQQKATRTRFTDAGGMTRLNLDELSE